MRIDDIAEPSSWQSLLDRIAPVDLRVRKHQRIAKLRRTLLGKLQHKVCQVKAQANNNEEWLNLIATVQELINCGVAPSNCDIREALLPVIHCLPTDLDIPEEFRLVVREINQSQTTNVQAASRTSQRSEDFMEVAKYLKGRSMVLIGGEKRPDHYRAIKQAFGLQELYWLPGREQSSIAAFKPYIAKPDVVLVLLAIRWCSHSFGDIQRFCDRHNKLMVRLPGGYNPNQIAAQIAGQALLRLKATSNCGI